MPEFLVDNISTVFVEKVIHQLIPVGSKIKVPSSRDVRNSKVRKQVNFGSGLEQIGKQIVPMS